MQIFDLSKKVLNYDSLVRRSCDGYKTKLMFERTQ